MFIRGAIDEELYDELEEVLIQADVSVSTATALVDEVRKRVKSEHITQTDAVEPILRGDGSSPRIGCSAFNPT